MEAAGGRRAQGAERRVETQGCRMSGRGMSGVQVVPGRGWSGSVRGVRDHTGPARLLSALGKDLLHQLHSWSSRHCSFAPCSTSGRSRLTGARLVSLGSCWRHRFSSSNTSSGSLMPQDTSLYTHSPVTRGSSFLPEPRSGAEAFFLCCSPAEMLHFRLSLGICNLLPLSSGNPRTGTGRSFCGG